MPTIFTTNFTSLSNFNTIANDAVDAVQVKDSQGNIMYGIDQTGTPYGNLAPILIISGAGTGSGTVSSTPSGISCVVNIGGISGTCFASFGGNTQVTLIAAANNGSTFVGWSGLGCSGTGNCIPNSNSGVVTANFSQTIALTITGGQGNNQGTGTVTTTDGLINCILTNGVPSGACSAAYSFNANITLNATGTGGSTFNTFIGGTCTVTPCNFNIISSLVIQAIFNPPTPNITFVQSTSNNVFNLPQTAGNTNIIGVTWNDNINTITSVSDTFGNAYSLAKNTTYAGSGGTKSSFAQVGSGVGNGYRQNTTTRTCSMTNTGNNLLVVWMYSLDSATITYSIADTIGDTWNTPGLKRFNGNSDSQLFYAVVKAGTPVNTPNTITVTASATATFGIFCTEYSGNTAVLGSVLDNSNFTNAGSSGTTLSTSVTVTGSQNDLVSMVCVDKLQDTDCQAGHGCWQAGTNYSFIGGEDDKIFAAKPVQRLNVTSGGSPYTPTITSSTTSATWQCNAATFAGTTGTGSGGRSQSIYYSANIGSSGVAGNTITIGFSSQPTSVGSWGLEYTGITQFTCTGGSNNFTPCTANSQCTGGGTCTGTPLDQTATGANGSNTAPTSGSITTVEGNDLLIGMTDAAQPITAITSGFTQRILSSGGFVDIEDQVTPNTGTYNNIQTLSASGDWIAQLAAFVGVNQTGTPQLFPLTITGGGTGTGCITSNVGGINCWIASGQTCPAAQFCPGTSTCTCSASFASGTQVVLTEQFGLNSFFGGWSGGGCSGQSPTCTIVM